MKLLFKTRRNSSVQGKPRVYLAACKEDYQAFLEEIAKDILTHINCAVYYPDPESIPESISEDMRELDEESKAQLDSMQLIVLPITAQFLLTDNFQKDIVFPYVKDKKPIAPIMLEEDLLDKYTEVVGNIQFLDKFKFYEKDKETAIPYEDRLSKRLSDILVDDKEIPFIRDAFCGYVFLSYRKVDRKEAQQLMEIIHNDPACEDIAIWYDEFLIPGRDFNDSIQQAMKKSDLFALNVTDKLLEPGNYVLEEEYPGALRAGMRMVSVEMREVDKEQLRKNYARIEESFLALNEHDKIAETIKNYIKNNVKPRAVSGSESEHNYYIGLAYLNGIDVENNSEKGKRLVESAAKAGLIHAMKKMVSIYKNGEMGYVDFEKAVSWQENIVETILKDFDSAKFGEFNQAIRELYQQYDYLGNSQGKQKAIDIALSKTEEFLEESQNDLSLFEKLINLRLDAAVYWKSDMALAKEVLEISAKHCSGSKNVSDYIEHIRMTAKAVTKFRNQSFLNGVVPLIKELENTFGDKFQDGDKLAIYTELCNSYRTAEMSNLSPIGYDPDITIRIDEAFFANEFLWWYFGQKSLELCEKHSSDEDEKWLMHKAEIECAVASGMAKVIDINSSYVVEPATNEKMLALLEDFIEFCDRHLADIDLEKRKGYINMLQITGYYIFRNTPCDDRLEGITLRVYNMAVNEAENIYAEKQDRESLLFLWETVKYCCGIYISEDFSKRALEIAMKLNELDHTLTTRLYLADAYQIVLDNPEYAASRYETSEKLLEIYEDIIANSQVDVTRYKKRLEDCVSAVAFDDYCKSISNSEPHDYSKAIELLEKEKSLLIPIKSKGVSLQCWDEVITRLKSIYRIQNPEKLKELQEEHKEIEPQALEHVDKANLQIAEKYKASEAFDKALLYYEKAGAYEELRSLATKLKTRGDLKNIDAIIDTFKCLVTSFSANPEFFISINLMLRCEDALGELLFKRERYEEALPYFENVKARCDEILTDSSVSKEIAWIIRRLFTNTGKRIAECKKHSAK